MRTPLGRFLLKVVVWLPVAFVVWYFGAPVLLWPVKWVLAVIAHTGLPDLVTSVEQTAATFTFATSLKPGDALVLEAREPRWQRTLAVGYAVQLPFVAWGVLADFLKNIAITSGPLVTSQ